MKKILVLCLALLLVGCSSATELSCPVELPKPQVTTGQRGELGIDENINESTIDNYLGLEDSVYFDMRMLEDPADYAKIGGNSILTGYIKGFKILPYPYLCNVVGLPEAVGETYTGTTLWTNNENGTYTPNYEESLTILESLFPKDKNIFLMCGGGGYAGMTKQLLVALGWDADKIYNIGGYWFYEGSNKVEVSSVSGLYDFSNVPYYSIDFSKLTRIQLTEGNQNIIDLSGEELEEKEKDCSYLALFVYNPDCPACEVFRGILEQYLAEKEMKIYSIKVSEFINCDSLAKTCVNYTPSLVIFNEGKILDYLNPADDKDTKALEDYTEFSVWMTDKTEEYCLGDKNICKGYCTING